MQTYTAHATMRSGIAQQMRVSAESAIAARRAMFRLNRAIASLTMPRVVGEIERTQIVSTFMRRAGDEVAA